jgi:predicted PurR-regulated permease PerM
MAERPDLIRMVFAVLFIGVLIGASLWILQPFLGAIIWATMIVVATWPLLLACQRRLFGSRALAVTVMVLAMLLIFVVPLTLAIDTLVSNAATLRSWADAVATLSIPAAPAWLNRIPLIGDDLAPAWEQARAAGSGALAAKAAPYAAEVVRWFLAQLSGFGVLFLQFLLTVVIAAILWTSGERAAGGVLAFARRLAGQRGESSARLAGQAIRGVALGVVVTALVQSVIAGIGLAIASVPFAGVLTAVVFMLTLAQLGPLLVLAPAVIWLYTAGATGWGTFMLIWTVFVATLDNFLRPWLIKKGAHLPLLLIFAGVIGGLMAFGIIGIFIGPVVLAVGWTLLGNWVDESSAVAADGPAAPGTNTLKSRSDSQNPPIAGAKS